MNMSVWRRLWCTCSSCLVSWINPKGCNTAWKGCHFTLEFAPHVFQKQAFDFSKCRYCANIFWKVGYWILALPLWVINAYHREIQFKAFQEKNLNSIPWFFHAWCSGTREAGQALFQMTKVGLGRIAPGSPLLTSVLAAVKGSHCTQMSLPSHCRLGVVASSHSC